MGTASSKAPQRSPREKELVDHLLSASIQVPLPREITSQQPRLTDDEIQAIFRRHVPGIDKMTYRGKSKGHTCILKFFPLTYRNGMAAPEYKSLNIHFTNLFRLIVHYAESDGPNSATHLREIAEAFQDCQAMQARAIERVGLRIQGVEENFKGLLTRLVGEYKAMAVSQFSEQAVTQERIRLDPIHYSSRITADVGEQLGLNADDIRRAALDEIAERRLSRLSRARQCEVVGRVRDLFDLDALLSGLVAEVGRFNAGASENSFALRFLEWSSQRLRNPHLVLDKETQSRGDIDETLAMAVLEDVFLGEIRAPVDECYKDVRVGELFNGPPG